MCPMQTLHRGLSGHQKRHCSGAFWSHDIIYGLSEALWTLAISLECLKVAVRCIESRYLFMYKVGPEVTLGCASGPAMALVPLAFLRPH